VLVLPRSVYLEMVAHCLDAAPLEGCGLLGGTVDGDDAVAATCYPATNDDHSARTYTVAPKDLLRADRAAEDAGGQLIGVYHSHTHTEAEPSPTDVRAAPDPGWHYVLVSLRDTDPAVRSWRIPGPGGGVMEEEPVVLE
jgi:proteasome lid subunit RPN8/RPN11